MERFFQSTINGAVIKVEDDNAVIPSTMKEITAKEAYALINPEKPKPEFVSLAKQEVEILLDATAKKTDWKSMDSARATAGVPLLGDEDDSEKAMHAEATKLSRWFLKVWAFFYAQTDLYLAGKRTMTSVEDFIAELPALN